MLRGERIVLRAMARTPDARYLTAAEMLEDLAADAGPYVRLPVGVGEAAAVPNEDRARFDLLVDEAAPPA